MSEQPTGSPRETRWVNPRDLITRANVRTLVEADHELVDSIRVHGILQPPVVYADGQDLVLIAGHRRTAAAIAAGLERIEVTVGPRMDDQLRIAAQVSENTNRAGLRAVETAAAVEQMTLLGVPVGQIARAAGLRRAQVDAARKVAAADAAVREAIIETPDLTLDQAAELTAWGDDPDAVADLLAAAGQGEASFAHTQARLTERREREQEIKAAQDSWIAKGYQVLDSRERLPAGAVHVRELAAADGKKSMITGYYGVSDEHAACPDRAVTISQWSPKDVSEVCLDPKANKHSKAPSPYGGSAATKDKDAQERTTVIANNKLWKVAGGVREAHLAKFVRAGKFSPALVDALHRHLLAHPKHLEPHWKRELFDKLMSFPGSGVMKDEDKRGLLKTRIDPDVAPNRIVGQLLATVADGAERDLSDTTWRRANSSGVAWLDLLVTHTDYQLAEVETLAMKATDSWSPPKPAARGAAAAGPAAGAKARRSAPRPQSAGAGSPAANAGTTAPGSPRTVKPAATPAPAAAKKPSTGAGRKADQTPPARTATPPAAPPAPAAQAPRPAPRAAGR